MVECFCTLATRESNNMHAYASASIKTLVHFLLRMNTYVLQQGPALQSEACLIRLRSSWRGTMKKWKEECDNLKQNEAQSAHAQSTCKGVKQRSTDVTQTQQRPESPMVSRACMRVNTRYITRMRMYLPLVDSGLGWVCVTSYER